MFSPSRSLPAQTYRAYVAALVGISMLAWSMGLPGWLVRVEAAQVSNLSDTLSTSKPGVASNHTIRFTSTSGIPADGSTLALVLPAGFDMSTVTEDDVDIDDDGVGLTTGTSCGAVQAAVSTSTQTILIQICSGGGGAIASTSVVTVRIGTNATSSGIGVNRIVNHAVSGSYELNIAGTMADIGTTRLAIVDSVEVSGQVETYLDFQLAGVNAGQAVNGDASLTFATTTATLLAFGTVQGGTAYVLAQDLAVTTNALGGYTVTLQADGDLRSTSGATINTFTDGAGTAVPTAWTAPSGVIGNPDTYGHWGITTEDASLTDNDSFGNALYVGNFVGSPREVMHEAGAADGATANIGTTRVGFKLQTTVMQESGADYAARLTYVVTPVF